MRKKNVYTKSMFRQPLHSLILIFLLFIATFSFVLRSVEFFTVRDQMFSIAEYYQTIGFLRSEHEFGDVSAGADFLENNHFIEFTDRRRGVEAALQGVLNADIEGSHFWAREFLGWGRPHDAFFYGELIDKIERDDGGWRLILIVDDVLVGYPEHVVEDQTLQMDFNLEEGDASAIADMKIGERYFLRGVFNPEASPDLDNPFLFGSMIPTIGDENSVLLMLPLNQDELWYVSVPYGEVVDFMAFELEEILEEIEFLRRNHHEVQLRTTMDMSLIPFMLESAEMGFVVEGRLIDQNDHLNANPVAVIHQQFARIRNLSIGDMITVRIPQVHYVVDGIVTGLGGLDLFYEVRIESIPQDERTYEIELELEIVGIYNLFQRAGGDTGTTLSTYIYIPDSVLSDDVIISSDRLGTSDTQSYLSETWYSFMLGSSRDEVAFVAENRLPLEEMGFTLIIVESGAENFWESANIILQSIMFNGVVFSIVLILVLLFVIFLFLRQRRKELAVSRMLGYSINRIVREILTTATIFFVPITIGGILAWLFARQTIVNTLQTLEEAQVNYEAYEMEFALSFHWLVFLIIAVYILTMLMALIGAKKMTRRPVLDMLQGKK